MKECYDIAVCHAALTTKPQNIAAYAGKSIQLGCASSSGDDPTLVVGWYEYITNSGGQVISINDQLSNPPNAEIYSISNPSSGVYNLGIELRSDSGGRYGCQQLVPEGLNAYAHVIVFGE